MTVPELDRSKIEQWPQGIPVNPEMVVPGTDIVGQMEVTVKPEIPGVVGTTPEVAKVKPVVSAAEAEKILAAQRIAGTGVANTELNPDSDPKKAAILALEEYITANGSPDKVKLHGLEEGDLDPADIANSLLIERDKADKIS